MKIGIGNWARPFASVWRVVVFTLVVCAKGGAWADAPVPTVVWQSGEFNQTKDGYSINLPSNVFINGDGNIQIGASATSGATIDLSGNPTKVSVLVKYRAAPKTNLTGATVAATVYAVSTSDGTDAYDVGVVSQNASSTTLYAYYNKNGTKSSGAIGSSPALSADGGYLLFAYDLSKTYAYTGTSLSSLTGGSCGTAFSNRILTKVSLGGVTGSQSSEPYSVAWPGMVIEKIAVFVGNKYEGSDVAEYTFPTAGRYDKWSYAEGKVLTWQTASNAAGNNGDYIAYSDATYDVFDVAAGADSGTSVSNGDDSKSMVHWQRFCFGQSPYKAPGYVLRLAGDYYKSVHGKFSPMTVGGLIVEPGATGYSFPSEGTRSAALGDPTGKVETWFDINESFTIARTGKVAIMGTVNMDIAQGKTFTLSSNASLMKVANVDTSTSPQLPYLVEGGGELKMHGEGQLVVTTLTATNAVLNYADLGNRANTNPFINGTLVIDQYTHFVLPSGTTSPYKVATTVSAETYPTSITIGSKTYPIAVSAGENAGEIAWTICEADIDAAGTYGLEGSGEDDLFASISSTGAYIINVNESATLNVASATSLGTITFNVASGKTLTLTGAAITATGGIVVNGSTGIISMTSSALVGAFSGDGVVKYTMVQPRTNESSSVDFTNSAWTGTVWLYDWNYSAQQNQALYVSYWCNSGSKLKFTKVKGYLPASGQLGYDGSTLGELVLEDEGSAAALNRTDGYSHSSANNYYCAFAKLSGSGTFTDSKSQYIYVVFGDISTFTGTFKLTYSTTIIVDESSPAETTYDGKLYVAAGKTASVSAGKTWNFANGVFVNGTVELNDGATIPKVAAASTGSLTVTPGTGTVSGVDASVFPVRITVYPNATLAISDSSVESLTIPAEFTDFTNFTYQNGGTLDLSGCKSLTTLRLDLGSSTSFSLSNVTLPATCTTIKYVTNLGTGRAVPSYTSPIGLDTRTWQVELSATETKAEYANGSFELTGLPSDTTVVVTRADGTTASATVSNGTAHLSDYGAVKISGSATLYDVTFTNTYAFAYTSKSNAMFLDSDVAEPYYNNNLNDETTGLYIRHHPYTSGNNTDLYSLEDFSAVVVGQMSPTANTIFIHMGSSKSGTTNPGLLIATTANKDEVIIAPNSGSTVDADNAVKVKVPNAATARHAYVIRRSGNTFTVSVDGIARGNFTVSDGFKLGTSDHSGIQVGSDFGAGIKNNTNSDYAAVANSEAETGVVNLIRLYDYVLTEAQERALTDLYPYISEGGLYTRTISANANLSSTDAWTKEGDDTLYTLPEGATVDEVAYDPSVTITMSETAALTVNASLAVDTLTIQSASGATLTFSTDGTHSMAVSGAVVVNSPLVVEYGSLNLVGTPVQLGSGGSINFDCSAMDVSEIYSTTRYRLTGLVTRDDNNITATLPPSVAYRTCSLEYNSNGYYELVVTPNHEDGAEVYFKSGYLKGNMAASGSGEVYVDSSFTTRTALFPNDVMVVNDNSKLWQDQLFMDTSFAGNIRFSRTTAATLRNGEVAGTFLAGCTVTVDEGCSLTIARHSSGNYALTLADVTVNGTGTATLSDPMSVSGAVSGTAVLTISGTVNVASGGSIANAVAGTGTIAYATLPASALTFGTWTGTVKLPAIESGAIIFNNYGTTGSTVYLTSMSSSAWIKADNTTIDPKLYLAGNMTLATMSPKRYTFAEIDGPGNLSFATSGSQPTAINITKVAENYSGTISSTLTTPVTIDELKLSSLPTCDQKILSVGGAGSISLDISNIKVGESPLAAKYKVERRPEGEDGDGFYVYYNGTIFSVW